MQLGTAKGDESQSGQLFDSEARFGVEQVQSYQALLGTVVGIQWGARPHQIDSRRDLEAGYGAYYPTLRASFDGMVLSREVTTP
jgi:hypothetical protein